MNQINKKPNITVNCPTCSKQIDWQPEQRWRPFCSERCKLIDLGEWASESYNINGEAENEFQTNPGELNS